MQPIISVVIPVYNTSKEYLEPSLKSTIIYNKSVEVIIVDDGSKNEQTIELCDKFAEQNDNVSVFHIENAGVSSARNFGVQMAKGEYVLFLDSDDELTSDAFEQLLNTVSEKAVDIVLFDYYKAFDNRIAEIKYSNQNKLFLNENCYEILKDSLVVEKSLALCWGKIFKRSFLIQNNLAFNKDLVAAEDADFAISCYSVAKSIFYLSKTLYKYNVFQESAVRTFKKDMPEQYIKSMNHIIDVIKETNNNELLKYVYNFSLYHLLLIIVNNVFSKKNTATLREKYRQLNNIGNNKCFSEAIKYLDYSLFSKTRAITLFFYKHGLYFPLYLIALFRQSTR